MSNKKIYGKNFLANGGYTPSQYMDAEKEQDNKRDSLITGGLSIAGSIAGAFLGNPMLGAEIGKTVGNTVGNFTANGGNIKAKSTSNRFVKKITGPSHEANPVGGTPLGNNNYAEGGEYMVDVDGLNNTKSDSKMIFSDRLKFDKKQSWAQKVGKDIKRISGLRGDNDKITKTTLGKVMKQNEEAHESQKEFMNSIESNFAAMGGKKYFDGGTTNEEDEQIESTNFANSLYNSLLPETEIDPSMDRIASDMNFKKLNPNGYNIPDNSKYPTTPSVEEAFNLERTSQLNPNKMSKIPMINLNNIGDSYKKLEYKEPEYKELNKLPKETFSDSPKKDNSKLLAGIGAGLQGLAGLHQLSKGLRGGDTVEDVPVKAVRVNPKTGLALATKNAMRVAAGSRNRKYKTQAEQLAADSAVNAGLYDAVGNTTLNAYLSPMEANAGREQQTRLANQQMKMTTNDWRQREKDAASTAVTEGLGRTGSGIAGGIKDNMAYNAQDKYINQMEGLLNKYSSHFNADGTVKESALSSAMGGRIKYNFKKKC